MKISINNNVKNLKDLNYEHHKNCTVKYYTDLTTMLTTIQYNTIQYNIRLIDSKLTYRNR